MKKIYAISIILILTVLIALQISAAKSLVFKNQEELVKEFISSMVENRFGDLRKLTIFDEVGYIPKMNSNEVKENHSKDRILRLQYEYIKELFGEDAWKNVSYRIEKANSPEKFPEFILKETGEIISENEARKITKQFWDKIAKDNKTNDLIRKGDYIGEKTNKNSIDSYSDAILKGVNEPVEVNLIDMYEYCEVFFTFNNNEEAKTGEKDFKISICNKDGIWRIYQGVTWLDPIEDVVEDI